MINIKVIEDFCDKVGYDPIDSEPGFKPLIGFELDKENPGRGVADFIKYLHNKNCNLNDYLNRMNVETDCVYFTFPDDYYAF